MQSAYYLCGFEGLHPCWPLQGAMTIIPEKLDILTVICNCLMFELKYVLLKEMCAAVGEGTNISILFRFETERRNCLVRARTVQKIIQRGKYRCTERIDVPQQSTKIDMPK